MFSAGKLRLNGNPGYDCTNTGRETITSPIRPLMKFTLESIRKKSRKKFNTGWRKALLMMKSALGNEGASYFVIMKGDISTKQISNHILALEFSMF